MATQVKDSEGNIISSLDSIGGQTIVDTRVISQNLGAVNAETILYCQNTNSVAIDVRGTFVGTMVVQYSVDNSNYNQAAIFIPMTELFVANITATGTWVAHLPSGVRQVRVLMTAYTSGVAIVSLRGSEGDNFIYAKPLPTILSAIATAAVSTGVTLSIPAGGVGLFHYITRIRISKYIGATLTAAATPSIVTTTNLSNSPSFDFKTLGSLGDSEVVDLDFTGNPLKCTTANTATTIVAPVLTGAIWKITAWYYLGA